MPKNPMDEGYVLVAERLAAFQAAFPNGLIRTSLEHVSFDPSQVVEIQLRNTDTLTLHGVGLVVVRAEVWKDRTTVGYTADGFGLSSMPIPGPTNFTRGSEVENAETSAVGRALAMIGFLAKDSTGKPRISSADEIAAKKPDDEESADTGDPNAKMTARQRGKMFGMAKEAGIDTASDAGKSMLRSVVADTTGKQSSSQLTNGDMDAVYAALDELKKVKDATGGGTYD